MSLPINIVNDFYLEVVKGNVTGYAAREIVGVHSSLGDVDKDIWNYGTVAGNITEAATAAVVYVSSDDEDDKSVPVTITGVDANYDEITEVITTDADSGQTPVAGTKAFLAINKVEIAEAVEGNLYVYYNSAVTAGVPNTASKVQAVIDKGFTQSYNAFYTVPRNKKLYLTSYRYRSTGSDTKHDVIINLQRKLYGETTYTTVGVSKYTDPDTAFIENQVAITDSPIEFAPKSKFKVQASLSGGTKLNIAFEAKFVEESIAVEASTTSVVDKTTYLALLTSRGSTISAVTYYLIGLDALPVNIPSSFNMNDLLATITGTTSYRVAADTEVVFDPAYFTSGKLVTTTKKAILTVMRCVDDDGNVDYVLAPVNTLVNLGSGVKKTAKISYLA